LSQSRVIKMVCDKRYKAVNKICIYFTQPQMDFLNLMSKEQGEGKSTIIRKLVNDLLVSEMQKKEAVEKYSGNKK